MGGGEVICGGAKYKGHRASPYFSNTELHLRVRNL